MPVRTRSMLPAPNEDRGGRRPKRVKITREGKRKSTRCSKRKNIFNFMDLPVELRTLVYTQLFTLDDATSITLMDLHQPKYRYIWRCLELSKEFRNEGSKVLFGNNVLGFPMASNGNWDIYGRHWQRTQFVSRGNCKHFTVAIPLPTAGKVKVSRPKEQQTMLVQLGTQMLPAMPHRDPSSRGLIDPSLGPVFEVTDLDIPRQSWDALKLIKHARFRPLNSSYLRASPQELICALRLTADVINRKLPNIVSAELDVTAALLPRFRVRVDPQRDQKNLSDLSEKLKPTPMQAKQFCVVGMEDLDSTSHQFQVHGVHANATNPPTSQTLLETHSDFVAGVCELLQKSTTLMR